MDTKSNFIELLNLIEITRPNYIEGLGKGYSRQEIESYIKIHPIPKAIITIYSCVGGDASNIYSSSNLIPAYDLIPLNRINQYINIHEEIRYELFHEISESKYSEVMTWEPDMIPLLSDGSGYKIFVRTLPNDKSVWVIPKALEPYKINTNLDLFILTAIECYKQGAYYQEPYEDVVLWATNETLAQEIVKNIDPEIENYSSP